MSPNEVFYTNKKQLEIDYFDVALITMMHIHLTKPKGDFILFLQGRKKTLIDITCQTLYETIKSLRFNIIMC
jgi:HrpA-like RNA helicase